MDKGIDILLGEYLSIWNAIEDEENRRFTEKVQVE